ncbi:MAG: hypothetical protein Q8O67_11350 [Deltaproteobacteria bacterium]|nr:hypothetical protein [Deltaproteobacteria bacterium]
MLIKLVHTVVWALIAGCIIALPIVAWTGRFAVAVVLITVVLVEVVVLALSGGRCPLTPLAARYTNDRRDNFDIYLPLTIARYNKQIFSTLFLIGVAVLVARWTGWA